MIGNYKLKTIIKHLNKSFCNNMSSSKLMKKTNLLDPIGLSLAAELNYPDDDKNYEYHGEDDCHGDWKC